MIVPINIKKREYQPGDRVLLVKEISCGYVIFTIGHELTVLEKVKNYSYYRLKDEESGIVIGNVDPREFTLKTDLQEAKQIYTNIKEKAKVIKFIENNCPKRGRGFFDRDEYDSCTLLSNRSYGAVECVGKLSCINYVDKSKIDKDDFIKVYMRKIKINKLKTE